MRKEILEDMTLEDKMNLYRKGLISLPDEYIDTHLERAENRLSEITDLGFKVENKEIKSDGWGDGFKVIHATLIDRRNGDEIDIKWHDGNDEFFRKLESGGSAPLGLMYYSHSCRN